LCANVRKRLGALRTNYLFLDDITDIIGFFLHEKHHKLCEENEEEVLTHTHTHTHTHKVFKVHKLKNKNFELSP